MSESRPDPRLVSVIVPAFREAKTIFASLGVLLVHLDQLGRPYEVLVVSDGSDDDTTKEASRHPSIRVLDYPLNRGKGYAVRYGIAHAQGSLVVVIDADMELHPSGIQPLVSLVDSGADVAIGSKRHPLSQVSYPMFRRLQSRCYQRLVRMLFSLELTDTQTGLKVMRTSVVQQVTPQLKSDGFAFDLELLVALHDAGAKIVEGPIALRYAFSTTTSLRAAVDMLVDTFRIWRRRRLHAVGSRVPADDAGATRLR